MIPHSTPPDNRRFTVMYNGVNDENNESSFNGDENL